MYHLYAVYFQEGSPMAVTLGKLPATYSQATVVTNTGSYSLLNLGYRLPVFAVFLGVLVVPVGEQGQAS